jgi:hypothetical protein
MLAHLQALLGGDSQGWWMADYAKPAKNKQVKAMCRGDVADFARRLSFASAPASDELPNRFGSLA